MNRRNLGLILPLMAMGALTSGCARSADEGGAANNAAQPADVEAIAEPDAVNAAANGAAGLPTDEWVGRWNGPEGLFLDIQPSPDGRPGHYAIANQDNLDRQGDYPGVAEGATIRFVRDGRDLSIRPGTGAETGFKDLAGRQDCLIVLPGREGYCR
ncbi:MULTISPECIES: hypothetical protein [Sphingobium]|jgi:hypothetical protein|uniref:Lipoprotein n=2 Tax=Sphingobium fuliginis (strain ATCC 27551) TaxID=336203 RepID=A0A292ZI53_SPHSA|nr:MULTISPECIES: hypothetical protein [Sphingobium]QDC35923.1 hypothetical protein FIL70_00375 [Sphingobium fuliginis ATCC 27551]QOT71686.1 hypothetical protein H5V43_00385 [Sphingobium fuliginis]UXC90988.1 hypothetical protein EGM87_00385 [Sphingobium sp. RSMS]GAY22616.1 hypothetical protein SFOMI_3175 [Sphingobium fuliginis]